MNKIIYIIIATVVSILTLASCDREIVSFEKEDNNGTNVTELEGTLSLASLNISVNVEGVDVSTRSSVDVSSYIVAIYEEGSNTPVKYWKYSDMPELFAIKVGSYRVDAYSHEPDDAEWEKPYFYATQDFDVKKDEVTELATLVCTMKSIKVSVLHSDELKELLHDDVVVEVTVNNKGSLQFKKDETRHGHFKPDTGEANIIIAKFSGTVDGQNVTKEQSFSGVKAGEHRVIQYSLVSNPGDNIGEGGTPNISIEIDATCEMVNEDVTVNPGKEDGIDDFPVDPDPTNPGEGGDEGDGDNDNPNAPTIVGTNFAGSSFDINTPLTIPGEGCDLIVTLNAPKGLANVEVTIDSEKLSKEILEAVGLTDKFDLAYPGAYEEGLNGLGFATGAEVIGKTELLFNITDFTPLLGIYGAGTHNFIIKVIDSEGVSVLKTLILVTE